VPLLVSPSAGAFFTYLALVVRQSFFKIECIATIITRTSAGPRTEAALIFERFANSALNFRFGSFASLLANLQLSAIRPISDLKSTLRTTGWA
jgi:hypothetical protein